MTTADYFVQNSRKEVWTVRGVLDLAAGHFRAQAIPTPRLDAELLLAKVLNLDRLQLYLQSDRPLSTEESTSFSELVQKRVKGMPVAYLTGEKEFWSLSLKVNESVLTPRPETELLVEAACDHIRIFQKQHPYRRFRVFEFGTGSGAISLALCSELRSLDIIATDVSFASLKVASANLERHRSLLHPRGNRVTLVAADGVSMLNPEPRMDFVLSNPPYIPSSLMAKLSAEVRCEPGHALDGGRDGLDYYRMLLKSAPLFLRAGGEMLLEIGHDLQSPLEKLLESHPDYQCLGFHKDLGSHPRVLNMRLKNHNGT